MKKTLSEIVFAISIASALTGCATKHAYVREERVTDPIQEIYLQQESRTEKLRGNYDSNTITGFVIFKKEGTTGYQPTPQPTRTPTPVPPEGL